MPTAKALGYDHDVYLTPIIATSNTTAGAQGVSQKFCAFTDMQIRCVTLRAATAGTSATTPLLVTVSGTASSTTTLSAVASAAITVSTNVLSTAVSLSRGDMYWCQNGTDATVVFSVAVEAYPTPGASVACP